MKTNILKFEKEEELKNIDGQLRVTQHHIHSLEETLKAKDNCIVDLESAKLQLENKVADFEKRIRENFGESCLESTLKDQRERDILHQKIIFLTKCLNDANNKVLSLSNQNLRMREAYNIPAEYGSWEEPVNNLRAQNEYLLKEVEQLETERKSLNEKIRSLVGMVQDRNPHALFEGLSAEQGRILQLFALSLHENKAGKFVGSEETLLITKRLQEFEEKLLRDRKNDEEVNREIVAMIKNLQNQKAVTVAGASPSNRSAFPKLER